MDGAGDVALVPLVRLADVDEERRLGPSSSSRRARRVDLVDLGLDLRQQLSVARHDYPEYSGTRWPARGAGFAGRYPRRRMSARTRVLLIAGLAAAIAVGRDRRRHAPAVAAARVEAPPAGAPSTKPRAGAPPLLLDLGVRDDAEAQALAPRVRALPRRPPEQAGRIFARYDSLPAQIGAAFAAWPDGGLDALKRLVASHPHSALAELHLGLAYFRSGRNADAVQAWRRRVQVEPDSSAAVSPPISSIPSLLAPGLPFIVHDAPAAPRVASLPPPQELRALARAARRPMRTRSCSTASRSGTCGGRSRPNGSSGAAAALAPNDPMALTAAAVGSFSKARRCSRSRSSGPLTGRFPRSGVVRFHLGVLLLWTNELAKARKQLALAVWLDPRSPVCCAGEKAPGSSCSHWDQVRK